MSLTYTIQSVHGVKQTVVLVPPAKPAEDANRDQQQTGFDREADAKSNPNSTRSPR
jgi:hypothetical protein